MICGLITKKTSYDFSQDYLKLDHTSLVLTGTILHDLFYNYYPKLITTSDLRTSQLYHKFVL